MLYDNKLIKIKVKRKALYAKLLKLTNSINQCDTGLPTMAAYMKSLSTIVEEKLRIHVIIIFFNRIITPRLYAVNEMQYHFIKQKIYDGKCYY